jgi:hypothetical protein
MFKQSANLGSIAEWQPPQFDNGRDLAFIGFGALVLLVPLLRRSELQLEELLVVAMTLAMALRHSRMMFVFGIISAPVLCRLLADTWERYDFKLDRITPNLAMLLLAGGTVAFAFPTPVELQQQVERDNPVKAVDFLRRNSLSGRMLNEYLYGGYLIWAAPEYKVFIDGRADIFDWTGVLRDYGSWATLTADPKAVIDKYNISFCLIRQNAPIAQVLPYIPGWKQIYSDDSSVIFTRLKAQYDTGR